ncbi:hypothetical protein H206_05473 [Candidatus Electrothrix aarhusensis]|uniref:Uncharacterized protein n=1 Tax=Candidatus Electrothrix aarhusensis TaxID=1859131 RepID=A0A3S3QUA9_9BACT|nr:hypothetical protein H206_05473 [Candidatus Electrothrix aarhusensis]
MILPKGFLRDVGGFDLYARLFTEAVEIAGNPTTSLQPSRLRHECSSSFLLGQYFSTTNITAPTQTWFQDHPDPCDP